MCEYTPRSGSGFTAKNFAKKNSLAGTSSSLGPDKIIFNISVTGRQDIGNREEFQFTFIFWEKVDHVKFFDFLCEQIFFVHEKNDGGVVEPWVGDDGLKQQNTFFHTTLKTRKDIKSQ